MTAHKTGNPLGIVPQAVFSTCHTNHLNDSEQEDTHHSSHLGSFEHALWICRFCFLAKHYHSERLYNLRVGVKLFFSYWFLQLFGNGTLDLQGKELKTLLINSFFFIIASDQEMIDTKTNQNLVESFFCCVLLLRR